MAIPQRNAFFQMDHLVPSQLTKLTQLKSQQNLHGNSQTRSGDLKNISIQDESSFNQSHSKSKILAVLSPIAPKSEKEENKSAQKSMKNILSNGLLAKIQADSQRQEAERAKIKELLKNRYYNNNFGVGNDKHQKMTRDDIKRQKLTHRFPLHDIVLSDKDFYYRMIHRAEDRNALDQCIVSSRLNIFNTTVI